MPLNQRWFVSTYRGVFGLLVLAALIFQFSVSRQKPNFKALNFWAFFTNLSNLMAAVVFIVGAVRPSGLPSARRDLWRGVAVLCMTLTGVVFTLLLTGVDVLVLPSVNVVVHYLMPAAVFADWLIDPPQTRLTLRQGLRWLGFPLVYIVVTLVRGSLTHWYPYPFFSPEVAGYRSVVLHCAGMFIGLIILTWGIVGLGNARRRPACEPV